MPVELLQFGGMLAAITIVTLLWFVLVYRARRTEEGDGTPRGGRNPSKESQLPEERESPGKE